MIDWADITAINIFHKIAFCQRVAGFRVHENTITQELLYSFWQLAVHTKVPVELYQSKDEKANGNDIEIAIQTRTGYFLFPAQAKMINDKGRYPAIRHKVSGQFQIDRLLEYGEKVAGIPIYLFYNVGSNPSSNDRLERMQSVDIQRLGCSVFPAKFLKDTFYQRWANRWSTPEFYTLHYRLTIPFSNLFHLIDTGKIPGLNLSLYGWAAKAYTKQELRDEPKWRNLTPPPSIGRIPVPEPPPLSNERSTPEGNPFNPALRIVFPIEKEFATIRMS